LEGSDNGVEWVPIRTHTNEAKLALAQFSTASWPVTVQSVGFRHFRLFNFGVDSDGSDRLACAGIELYGTLTVRPLRPKVVVRSAVKGWAALRAKVRAKAVAMAVARAFPEQHLFEMDSVASMVIKASSARALRQRIGGRSGDGSGGSRGRTVAALRLEASHFENTPHMAMLTEREGHKCLVNEAAVAVRDTTTLLSFHVDDST
jgi:hypothetical protein